MTCENRRTRDGLRLSRIVRAVTEIPRITVRTGSRHPYVLNYPNQIPCPVAESTDARRMIVPWLIRATGLDRQNVYQSLRRGRW